MGEPDPLGSGQLAAGRSWCLRRLGMDREWLQLEAASEVTIGRGFGVTYQLISEVCPLMISRNHCVLKQNPEGQWTIMDNESLNGVWLNRERLAPLQVYCIQKGDHIQLGVPLDSKGSAEYEYEVIEEDWGTLSPCLAPKNAQRGGKNEDWRTKRKFSLDGLESPAAEGPSALKCKVIELYPKKQKASSPSASQSSLELFKVTMSRILRLKTQVHEKQIAVLNVKRQTRKGSSKKIVRMEKELQDLQSQLYAEQAQQQARVEQLEKTFQEEEHHLQGLEKEPGEEHLKQQLVQALQEHRALMEELNRSKKDFEKIIQAKNKELEQTKAVTLNCAHSFCSFCISEWMKRKAECPICRKDIESQTHSLVLDNCINKMVDNLGSEVKERRSLLLRERKEADWTGLDLSGCGSNCTGNSSMLHTPRTVLLAASSTVCSVHSKCSSGVFSRQTQESAS
ncbi:E3 ubiquitin-protein ligase RNF8 [Microtus ochrogaster]|uniref:E3 ubiquitin-protein ligase CHFR n=1 Tax=Microtus ochrogaster TaxID=79684 RepID=A0A8J6GVV5_MICOH|nr:E3 ubiquitin-protein ligase RNF8 [Microtus ochrogaster]